MEREVIIAIEDLEKTRSIRILTDFSQEDLDATASAISSDLYDNLPESSENELETDVSVDMVLAEMERKGYIKILGDGPEVYCLDTL